ncbi:MAG: response regulator [Acidobacteriota bacterium]
MKSHFNTILILSDEPDNIQILSDTLADRYQIIVRKIGDSSTEAVPTQPSIDLILIDIPVLDDDVIEFCRSLSASPATTAIPVVVLSTTNDEEGIVKVFSAGANDYITKPFRLSILKERISSHIELVRAKTAAEKADRIKSEFLANMSHDIRTPLNAIIGINRLAIESHIPEEQVRYGQMVQESAEGLLRLLNDILDHSKVEAGQLDLEHQPLNLQKLIESVVNLLIIRAQEKGLTLRCVTSADLDRLYYGDPLRLRQILFNLVQNAIKFTSEGSVTVTIEPHHDGPEADEAEAVFHFSIKDTGPGIVLEKQETVFGAFDQEDSSIGRRYGGTGLGLSIARRLVELMGGKIWLESEAGLGSTFHFVLPFARTNLSEEIEQGNEEIQVPPGVSGDTVRRSAPRVLLVEDDEFSRVLFRKLLETDGCAVTEAENGVVALEELAEKDFDIIFMDVRMPELDGLSTTRLIRQCETGDFGSPVDLPKRLIRRLRDTYTPIIALTANAMSKDRSRCLAAGMDEYLAKPILPEDLRAVLKTFGRRPH